MLKEKDGKFIVRLPPTTYISVIGMAIVSPLQLFYALDNLRGWVWLLAIVGLLGTLAAGVGVWMIAQPRTVIDPVRRCIDWGARTLSFDAVAELRLRREQDSNSESWHVSVLTTAARDVFEERVARVEARVDYAVSNPGAGITPEQLEQETTRIDGLLRRGMHELGSADSERKAREALGILAGLLDVRAVDETVPAEAAPV